MQLYNILSYNAKTQRDMKDLHGVCYSHTRSVSESENGNWVLKKAV